MFGVFAFSETTISAIDSESATAVPYPTDIGYTYRLAPINPRRADVATSGKVSLTDLSSQIAFRVEMAHPLIDAAQVEQLEQFYEDNRSTRFVLTLRGADYDMHFESPYTVEQRNAVFFDAAVTLVGNKQ